MKTAGITRQEPSAAKRMAARAGRRGAAAYTRRNGEGTAGLALGLGWFSIGLGLAEVAAPRAVARLIGVPDDDDNRSLLMAAGLREISAGIGILSQPRRAGWLWARAAGDAMDLTLLGAALSSPHSQRGRLLMATGAVLGVTMLDVLSAQRLSEESGRGERRLSASVREPSGVSVRTAITINHPPEHVYRFWRDFQNLPRFMSHLESVSPSGEGRSRWLTKGPAGGRFEWEADVIEDVPNQRIAWRTLRGDLDHRGRVQFRPAPGGRGTEVHVELHYTPPAGAVGAALARIFGASPEQQIKRDLRAFKQVLETGEVVHSDASIHRLPHPGRPSERAPTARAAISAHSEVRS